MMEQFSSTYNALCTEYYALDKPTAPDDALQCYLKYAKEAEGPILEPMCGTGRFLIPMLEKGYDVTGFDASQHMLDLCRRKSKEKKLPCKIFETSFETFSSDVNYNLIFIPNGSFGLLTQPNEVETALHFISSHLAPGGKFVFEIETPKAANRLCSSGCVNKADGTKLILNMQSRYDPKLKMETMLCRYEHWDRSRKIKTEVEELKIQLYEQDEIERLLQRHNLQITNKKANAEAKEILIECSAR